ncbi:MAG: hypothetical protein FJ280_19745 [Planctomycetes bacterium]|nr:hypothetical protein [Planctomycetota bacterium]
MRMWSNVLGAMSMLVWTCPVADAVEVKSPDGQVVLSLEVKDFEEATSGPVYSVTYRGQVVIAPSRLGLAFAVPSGGSVKAEGLGDGRVAGILPARVEGVPPSDRGPEARSTAGARAHDTDHRQAALDAATRRPILAGGLQIVRQAPSRVDTQWQSVYGERSTVRDRYNEVVVELQEQKPPQRRLHLTLRVYDEGAAFCYTLPRQPGMESVTIARELTEFGLVQETVLSGNRERVAAASAVFGACRWSCLSAIGKACAKPAALPLPPTQTVTRV